MTNSEADETALWQQARSGDGDAFAALFDLHRDRVYHRALGLLGRTHDAEEVTASAFFELWRKRSSVRVVGGSVLPWLLVTTVNLSRNSHRSVARYQRFLTSLPRDETLQGTDGEDVETRQRLAASLRLLSPVDASLFVLTAIEGVSLAEAAEAVGLRPATARVRLHRAKSRLRGELSDLGPTIKPSTEGSQP